MRKNRFFTYDGIRKCVVDWAKELGVCGGSVRYRVRTLGEQNGIQILKDKQNGQLN